MRRPAAGLERQTAPARANRPHDAGRAVGAKASTTYEHKCFRLSLNENTLNSPPSLKSTRSPSNRVARGSPGNRSLVSVLHHLPDPLI
eukprot:754593-Hanusia_phi.AAC.4